MQLTFLGTGTSTGVPALGCRCRTCTSTDAADRRLRSSVLLRIGQKDTPALLIDAGPDLRAQLLGAGSPPLGALLVSHIHYDHVGGMDDLRPYCRCFPGGRFPVYCRADVAAGLRHNLPYAFEAERYPGAPGFDLHIVSQGRPFSVNLGPESIEVMPVEVMHGSLPILGYRIGNLAYLTDVSAVNDASLDLLAGVDTLVVNALRPQPHPSHFSLEQALEFIAKVAPRRAYLTHISHDMPPAAVVQPRLPQGVFLARDGMVIDVNAASK